MSPFMVLFAVSFWTFLWGIAGAFIGVPIVIAILTICEQHASSRWVAELFGSPAVRAGLMGACQETPLTPILDPRNGDIEDDAASTKRRSLFSLTGTLLAEISLPKLVIAWMMLIGFPGLLLGAAPLLVSLWIAAIVANAANIFTEILPALLLPLLSGDWLVRRPAIAAARRKQLLVIECAGRSARLYRVSRRTFGILPRRCGRRG